MTALATAGPYVNAMELNVQQKGSHLKKEWGRLSEEVNLNGTKSVTDEDKCELYEALLELRESQRATSGMLFDKDVSHGFSFELGQDIVERCSEIFSIGDVMSSSPVFSVSHAIKILEVFQEIFGDIAEVFYPTSSTSRHESSYQRILRLL